MTRDDDTQPVEVLISDDSAPVLPAHRPTRWTVRTVRALGMVFLGLAVALSLLSTLVAYRITQDAAARARDSQEQAAAVEKRLSALEDFVAGKGEQRDAETQRQHRVRLRAGPGPRSGRPRADLDGARCRHRDRSPGPIWPGRGRSHHDSPSPVADAVGTVSGLRPARHLANRLAAERVDARRTDSSAVHPEHRAGQADYADRRRWPALHRPAHLVLRSLT